MVTISTTGSTSAASTNLRLSEAPGEDCRGGAIRRRRAIPMIAPNLLPFSYNSERQYSLKLHFNASLFYFSCQIEKPGNLERISVLGLWERLAAAIVLIPGCKPLPQVSFLVT